MKMFYGYVPRWRVGLMLASLVLCIGCEGNSILFQPNRENAARLPSENTDFSSLFANNCSGCHGSGGLQGPAPPIGNDLFLAMTSEEQLQEIIAQGRPGTLMPPFITTNGEGLTPQQVQIIAQGMKGSGLRGSTSHTAPKIVPPFHPAVTSGDPADVAAGGKLFAQHCAECHGENGRGDAMAGRLNDPALLELLSDRAIRTLIITGRPDLKTDDKEPMPSYLTLAKVTPENAEATWREIDQIVAYIASWRQAAAPAPVSTTVPMKKAAP